MLHDYHPERPFVLHDEDPCNSFDMHSPLQERWTPLGATSSPDLKDSDNADERCEITFDVPSKMSKLTAENEKMNNALMALTSHFAQVSELVTSSSLCFLI